MVSHCSWPNPQHIEVISDINGDLVALYRCIQYHLAELHREISFFISSRQILKDFVRQLGLTDIQRAARLNYKNRTNFSGGMTSFAIAKTQGGGAPFDPAQYSDLLGKACERLARVVIENVSYDRCCSLYDAPTSLFLHGPAVSGRQKPMLTKDGRKRTWLNMKSESTS